MGKIMNTLVALVASATLTSGAMADDTKTKPMDYGSLGVGAISIGYTDTIDGIEKKAGFNLGLDLTLRKALTDNIGLKNDWSFFTNFTEDLDVMGSLDLSVNTNDQNQEFYLGMGLGRIEDELYAIPNFGIRWHSSNHDLYFEIELGILVQDIRGEPEGVSFQLGAGYSWK